MDGNFIYEIKNFISHEECEMLIKKFDEDPDKQQSCILKAGIPTYDLKRRNSFDILMCEDEKWYKVNQYINEKLLDAIKTYRREMCLFFKRYNEDPKSMFDVMFDKKFFPTQNLIQRTEPNSEFGWHCDKGVNCVLSAILYLNDIETCDGGETEFTCGRKIKPEAGKLLLFPSTWSIMHRGCFVRKYKYMITNPIVEISQDPGFVFS